MRKYIALRHDPCPQCGMGVLRFSVYQDEILSLSVDRVVPPAREVTLWPCGHEVNSYTVDTVHGTVKWNTL